MLYGSRLADCNSLGVALFRPCRLIQMDNFSEASSMKQEVVVGCLWSVGSVPFGACVVASAGLGRCAGISEIHITKNR